MEKTEFTRWAKKRVEPPEPYSQTDILGLRKSSRKSIAAYENQGISRSRGVFSCRILWVRHREMYWGCRMRLVMTRPIFWGTVPYIGYCGLWFEGSRPGFWTAHCGQGPAKELPTAKPAVGETGCGAAELGAERWGQ